MFDRRPFVTALYAGVCHNEYNVLVCTHYQALTDWLVCAAAVAIEHH
jgi:hypothetical protein